MDIRFSVRHPGRRRRSLPPERQGQQHVRAQVLRTAPSVAPAGGGGPGRRCERHRRCRSAHCVRFCHTRESGVVMPYCSLHYCEAKGCVEERRADSSHCDTHAFTVPGCSKGRTAVEGSLCKEHKCLVTTCQQARMGSFYCPWHECIQEACEAEATHNRQCDAHQRCSEAGCAHRRFTSAGGPYDCCEKRK